MLENLLIVSILAGQLIKFPLSGNLGPTTLDFYLIVLAIYGIFKIKLKFKKPPKFLQLGFLFILITLFSLIFTPLHLSHSEFFFSFLYILRLILILFVGWVFFLGFPDFKKKIPQILMLSGIGLAILGLFQFLFFPNLYSLHEYGWDPHYFRTVSTFLDPNFAGAFFVLTLILITNQLQKKSKFFYIVFIITFIALLTTFSRSSYLMFLFSGLTFSFLKKSKIYLLLTFILFSFLISGFLVYTRLISEPKKVDRVGSASYRINAWYQGITIFSKTPVLGVGFNAYRYAIKEYQLSSEQFLKSRGSSSNDSSLLFVLATTGIIGFISYLFFLLYIIKNAFNSLQKNGIIIISALGGLMVHSFFSNSLFYPFILTWIILISTQLEN